MGMETTSLKRALKSYLKAKEINQNNTEDSIKYIYQSLKYLKKVKSENIDSKYNLIIDETETECHNLLNESLYTQNEKSNNISSIDIFNAIDEGNLSFFKNQYITKDQLYTINNEG